MATVRKRALRLSGSSLRPAQCSKVARQDGSPQNDAALQQPAHTRVQATALAAALTCVTRVHCAAQQDMRKSIRSGVSTDSYEFVTGLSTCDESTCTGASATKTLSLHPAAHMNTLKLDRSLSSLPSNTKLLSLAFTACWISRTCCATTDSTCTHQGVPDRQL